MGRLLPRGEAPGVELLLPDPGLGQDVGDDLLRGGVEEGVVDLRVLEEQHLVLEGDLVRSAALVVGPGDESP